MNMLQQPQAFQAGLVQLHNVSIHHTTHILQPWHWLLIIPAIGYSYLPPTTLLNILFLFQN